MAILIYQLFIVGTLLVTRVIAPKRLAAACLIWTVLTLVNLFWPPLIVLQLLVIWITYGVVAPAEKTEKASKNPRPAPPAPPPPQPKAFVIGVTTVSKPPVPQLRAVLADTPIEAKDSSFRRAVREATAPIVRACFSERSKIGQALERAERTASGPARLQLNGASADEMTCVDLQSLPTHPDSAINAAIKAKLEAEIADYAKFLASVVKRLQTPGIRPLFERRIADAGGAALLERIDSFRSGAPWRDAEAIKIRHLGNEGRARAGRSSGEMAAPINSRWRYPPMRSTALLEESLEACRAILDELRADEIRGTALAMKVPLLAHFTRATNLESILKHGLRSRAEARAMDLDPVVNDTRRLDGRPDATSLSIAFPNYLMFYKYRMLHRDDDWVVLLIDPSVLWTKRCGFCERNAADHRVRERALDSTTDVAALKRMFGPVEGVGTRHEQGLHDYDPTDPQAEVLVFEPIEPALIEGVVFDSHQVRAACADIIGDRKWKVFSPNTGPFGNNRNRATW